MSKSAAARQFGIDRKSVAKMLKHAVAPGYRKQSPPVRPKLDPFIPIIDQILEEDGSRLKKQRHTARRIFERLQDEHGFAGGITIVTDYVREKMRRMREVPAAPYDACEKVGTRGTSLLMKWTNGRHRYLSFVEWRA